VVPAIGIGLLVGAVLYIGAARWLQSVLFGVRPSDPVSILLSLAFLLGIAGIAALVPTIRAIRLDPASVLRES
jgi:ABC-type antimicrobial peptide transport system permease subunit